jgi:hypothetical protein
MATGTPMAPLHGRAEEARALGEVLDLLASGSPAITLVEGEAGIGKTRLLTETFDLARSRGLQIPTGRSEELGPRARSAWSRRPSPASEGGRRAPADGSPAS